MHERAYAHTYEKYKGKKKKQTTENQPKPQNKQQKTPQCSDALQPFQTLPPL